MTARLLLVSLLLGWLLPVRADAIPLPKIRISEEKDAEETVVSTGQIVERPDPDKMTLKETPKGSTAAGLVRENVRYDWTPGIDRSRASGPAAIRDAVLSDDASVLAVLERLGEDPGPFGSRVVFLNVANGTVLRYVELKDSDCTRLHFAGNSLLLLQKGGKESQDSLLQVPLISPGGCVERFRFPQTVSGFSSGPEGTLFIKSGVTLYQFSDSGKMQYSWKNRNSGGSLVCDKENGRVYTLFPGRIERCCPKRRQMVREDSIEYSGTPEYAIPFHKWVLAGESGQAPQLFFAGEKKSPLRLSNACSGAGLLHSSGLLFMVLDRNRDVGIFRLPNSPRPQSLIKVNDLRPQTNGEIRFLFRLPGRTLTLLALDDRGNLMRLQAGRRNAFQKTLLFSPADNL